MPEIAVPQSAGFPMAWWIWWFVAAFFVYGLLGVWFWRSARRHDKAGSKSGGQTDIGVS
jgi:hypothetical protein